MADQARPRLTDGRDPELVRAELAQTRARMSATIDEIEEVIVGKKEEVIAMAKGLRQRLDPLYRARQKPLAAIGIVFGAGLVVGLLTGGKKKPVLAQLVAPGPDAPPRSDLWESRARRLLRIAREQQEELAALREPEWEEVEYDEVDEDD